MSSNRWIVPVLLLAVLSVGSFVYLGVDRAPGCAPCSGSVVDGGLSTELRANVFTSSAQASAALDADPAGVVAVWDSRRQEAGTYGVYGRTFDLGGRPLSHEVRINEYARGVQRRPAVAKTPDGGIWVVWESHGQDGSGSGVVARRFDRALESTGPEVPVNETVYGDQAAPVVASGADEAALVAWTGPATEGPSPAVFVRRIDESGSTAEARLSRAASGRDSLPAIAALPNGGGLVAWARTASDADGIVVRRVSASGLPLGPELAVRAASGAIEPAIAASDGGDATIAWLEAEDGGYAVYARRLSTAGVWSSARRLAGPEDGWKSGVAVAAAGAGRTVVSFTSDPTGPEPSAVYALTLDAAGRPLGPRPHKLSAADGDRSLTAASGAGRIAWTPPGVLAVAWNGDAGHADREAVGLTLLAERPLGLPEAPALGEPRAAGSVSSSEIAAAVPPIWNPDRVPLERLPTSELLLGDFGFEAVIDTGWTPPDPEMAVGNDLIVVMTNGEIAAWDKGGNQLWADEIENSFGFWGELGTDNFVFDPEATWDPHAQRFVAMACERSDDFRSNFLLAVSKDAFPENRDDWHKYRLDVTDVAGNDIDSPNLSLSTDYILLTADFFAPDKYLILAIDKASVLEGGSPVANTELISGQSQQSMGIPVVYDDSATLYIVQSTEQQFSPNTDVILHAITDPIDAYLRQTFTLQVPEYEYPAAPPQKDTSSRPTLFEPRFWSVAQRDDSIWAVHHVNGDRTRVRWYEFALNGWPGGGSPAVAQVGEIDLGDGIYTYFPSIHVDGAGNAAITYARSATNEYISMGRATRRLGDDPDTFRPAQVVQPSQNAHVSGRWGDYSGTQADPVLADTFWGHHEFTDGNTFSWRTWVGRYDLRPAPMVLTAGPLVAGQDATVSVTGATAGATVYFAATGAGTGITELPGLNVALSLEGPIPLGTATADGSGFAELTFAVPDGTSGLTAWIQALESGHTTNWVSEVIQ